MRTKVSFIICLSTCNTNKAMLCHHLLIKCILIPNAYLIILYRQGIVHHSPNLQCYQYTENSHPLVLSKFKINIYCRWIETFDANI